MKFQCYVYLSASLYEDRSVRHLIWETFFFFFFWLLFGLSVVFIRLLALSVLHAVQGPTKDLKKSCVSLKKVGQS